MASAFRYKIGKLMGRVLISTGVVKSACHKLQHGDYILSLCFHAPSKEFFEACIAWLSKNGFNFISVNYLEKIINNEVPFPKGAVIITLDDGWQSNLDNIVPVADKYKVPVEIFVSTEVVEKGNGYWWSYILEARKIGLSSEPIEFFKTIDNEDRIKILEETKAKIQLKREALTIEQVKEISTNNFVSIGSHSVSHPILPRCTNEESNYEIRRSKEVLEEWTNKEIKHFAFPNGDYSNREISFLKRFGYTLAFGTRQQFITKEKLSNRYGLPRLMMVEGASLQENICRMVGVWPLKPKKKKVVYP
ncbi:MAG: polysaccharide deacetylase family protein [Bacteroidota bacterium]